MTSFVVPAWNEAALIGATVDAIHSSARALGEPYERHGRFVVLKHAVITSGRKLRSYSPVEVWGFMIRLAV